MSPLKAVTATTQATVFALGVLALGVVVGWVLRSAWLAVQDARAARRREAHLMSDEEFAILVESLRADPPPADLTDRVKASIAAARRADA